MSTTSKLGADMTRDDAIHMVKEYAHSVVHERNDQTAMRFWHIVNLLARQPAAPSVEQDECGALNFVELNDLMDTMQHAPHGVGSRRKDAVVFADTAQRAALARAASTSANVAQDELQVRGRMRLKVEKLAGSLTKAEETKNDIIGDDGEQVTGVRIGWGAWALLRASIIDLIEYKCDSDSALAAAYSANVAQGAEAVRIALTEDQIAKIAHYCETEAHACPGTNMWMCAHMAVEETLRVLAEPYLQLQIAEVCEDADGHKHIEAVIEDLDNLPKGMRLFAAPPAQTALTDAARDAALWRYLAQHAVIVDASVEGMVSFTVAKDADTGAAQDAAARAIDMLAAQSASGDTQ